MSEVLIRAKSLLRKSRRIDSWFLGRCGMNLYRGCSHDCAYCDGRAEKYRVEGRFGQEIGVKANALEVLEKELAGAAGGAAGQRELWEQGGARGGWSGFAVLGGGVGDSYQPLEEKHRLARGALGILEAHGVPVHVLTKSTLVLRDADILERIHRSCGAVVSFSISSADDGESALFEPCAPPPSERLKALRSLKSMGIPCGVFLLPVIPLVTDTRELIEQSVKAAAEAGADFVLFGGMTLKAGRQMRHFLEVLGRARPALAPPVRELFPGDPWGAARPEYYRRIGRIFRDAAGRYGMPPRMPLRLFESVVNPKDRVIVLLEHIHALLELDGRGSPYGRAAFRISRLHGPLEPLREELAVRAGIPANVARTAREILATGTSALYEELCRPFTPGDSSQSTFT